MLDGKSMLTEALAFSKISDADFGDEGSLLKPRRQSMQGNTFDVLIAFGHNLRGQTGALHIFDDNVSDASLRALYEVTGGIARVAKRSHSLGDTWDARRGDLVQKSRVLDVNIMRDDAEEIVLGQRGSPGAKKRRLAWKTAFVLDMVDNDDHKENGVPVDLQASFGSKSSSPGIQRGHLALCHWSSTSVLTSLWTDFIRGAQDVIGSVGGVQSLIPLFWSFLNGDIERSWAADSDSESRRDR